MEIIAAYCANADQYSEDIPEEGVEEALIGTIMAGNVYLGCFIERLGEDGYADVEIVLANGKSFVPHAAWGRDRYGEEGASLAQDWVKEFVKDGHIQLRPVFSGFCA